MLGHCMVYMVYETSLSKLRTYACMWVGNDVTVQCRYCSDSCLDKRVSYSPANVDLCVGLIQCKMKQPREFGLNHA